MVPFTRSASNGGKKTNFIHPPAIKPIVKIKTPKDVERVIPLFFNVHERKGLYLLLIKSFRYNLILF